MNENDETILLTAMSMSMSEQEKQLRSNPDSLTHDDMTLSTDHVTSPADNVTSPTDHVTQSHDLSSDDDDEDLIAFSVTPNACNVPHYLREAMSGIVSYMLGFHTYLTYPVYPLYSVTISFQTS